MSEELSHVPGVPASTWESNSQGLGPNIQGEGEGHLSLGEGAHICWTRMLALGGACVFF